MSRLKRSRRYGAAFAAAIVMVSLASVRVPANATTSTFSGSVDAAGTTFRWHPFDVTELGTITATLDWDNAGADLNLFLQDPTRTQVAKATTTGKPETLRYDATQLGTWRIGVKAKTGSASYAVTVEHSVSPPDPVGRPAGTQDWPMFAHDREHTGISGETFIGAANASSLGIQWQANTGQSSYTSPAVAWNANVGKHLVYAGNQSGTMTAYDAVTGERVWWYKAGASIQSSPAVAGNVLYFGASDEYLYALNATNGNLICRFFTDGIISSSPVVVDPDGGGAVAGDVVYVGDNGLTGADDGGHMWAIHGVDPSDGKIDCSRFWMYDAFGAPAGSQTASGVWSPPAFATDATGSPLVVFGGSSPDNAVYALDALTGSRAWRFQTEVFHPDNDVGAGPTISPPSVNGFAEGVAYVAGKDRIVYALNLRTGNKIWEFRIRDQSWGSSGATRSTAAFTGNRLFIGYGSGVLALNATTGAHVWHSQEQGYSTAEVIPSPALSGDMGDRVLFVGDLSGKVYAIRVSDGAKLWQYPTGGFIYGSAVVAAGRVFIAGSDGFLYAFGLGGGGSAKPQTTLVSPANGSTIANPNGNLTLSGAASDDVRVTKVLVAVKDKNANKWWNATTNSWSNVFQQNLATLGSPNTASTSWNLSVPMPFQGGVFFAQAEAVDNDGQHDATVATSDFTVESLGNPPETAITSPVFKQVFHFPDGARQSFDINVEGTASDPGGANRGIARVNIAIRNIEHGEYYCGSAGCGTGGETTLWTPTYTVLTAALASPGGNSTTWSFVFPTYDHPHKYRIVAWAVDEDGEADSTKAVVSRICVRDTGDNSCV